MSETEMLTIEEVSNALKVSKMTLYRYIKAGKISAYKLEQGWRIKKNDLDQFLSKRKSKA